VSAKGDSGPRPYLRSSDGGGALLGLARRLLSQLGMYQPIIAILGLLGLLFLVLLGGELNTDLDFSLRRVHSAPGPEKASAPAARSADLHLTDPRCAQP